MKTLVRFAKCESGATAIEYGLIAALISVAIIGVLTTVGTNLSAVFGEIGTSLAAPAAGT
jgi:pilus assembly protein Flp/PilA